MSETRVTINLGRAGQVVKRSGSKQFSDGFLSATKRPRVDELIWSPVGNRFNGNSWGTQYDLRWKLNQKRRMEELRKRHQRAKQLKPVQRQGIANIRMLEHQAKGSNLLRQYPSNHPDNSKQKYLLFQTEDGSRFTPQGRTLNSSKRPSSLRTLGRLRRVPVIRAADVSRDTRVLSNEVYHASRPTPIATMKAAAQFTKPVASIGYIMPKRPAMGVDSLLHSLGLGKYESRFEAEEVDMDALKQMSDKDLTNLGVPMGPRIKILRALKASVKQQPS